MPKCSCGKQSIFNVPGETRGVCCIGCKTDAMIDVKNKRCPCGSRPNFNIPGEMKPICCKVCKTDDMIDVKNKKCSCGKQPSFNIPGQIKGICCKDCKTDEMINVISKRCPCGTLLPKFNIPGANTGICCMKCKTDDMVNVVHKKCPCGKIPSFNIPKETFGMCCSKCKTAEMIDVMNKVCPGYNTECPVRTYIGRGREYCLSCDPDDDRKKRYKMFEEAFFAYIKNKTDVHKREFRILFDPNETSKKFARLDGVVFGDGVIVCLEVDEDGHRDYECDEHRMHLATAELLQKYPEHIVSWVRVNPTVKSKSQWSKTSKKIREKRFEEVVTVVNDILKTRNICVKYVGFE